MKKFNFKAILSVCMAIAFGIGALTFYPEQYQTVYAAATAESYYSSITATEDTALLGQLHDLITTTHTKYTSYDDCKNPNTVIKTDKGSNNSSVMEFYSQEDIAKSWGGGDPGTWNREHVWCQSRSNGMWGKSGAGSDLHHIRPAETRLNSTRGNHKYGIATNGTPAYYKNSSDGNIALGGYVDDSSDTFEPLDKVKGDVARIVFYVYTHYNTYTNVGGTTNGNRAGAFGTLRFTNIVAKSRESEAIKMLLEWNDLDPVDQIERDRNEAVYSIQGNRNPFIDNEDYADAIWGDGQVSPDKTSVKLNKTTLTLRVGAKETLTATTNGEGSLTWSTSNSNVISVSGGVLTAVGEGTATITAKYGTASATCKVTVSNDIVLDKTQVTLKVGESVKITADATGSVTWESLDKTIATVQDGTITAVNTGVTTVTAKCGNSTMSVKVTVVKDSGENPDPSDTNVVTVTIDSFSSLSGSYGFYNWSSGGVSGIAYIYGGEKNSMQFNSNRTSYYIASTSATPGAITSITVVSTKSERDWTLMTSTQPYGQVDGTPTNGNNRGSKKVSLGGATWNITGSDTYFSLNYDSGNSGAGYLVSITIEYTKDGGSEKPDPDTPFVESEFTKAVKNVSKANDMQGKFNAIKTAVAEYNKLSEEQKQEYSADYATLLSEINSYNANVEKVNGYMTSAIDVSAKEILVVAAAVAMLYFIKQILL